MHSYFVLIMGRHAMNTVCLIKMIELQRFVPTGLFLWDYINLPVVKLKPDVMQFVIEGLVTLMNETIVSKESLYAVIYNIFNSHSIYEPFKVFINYLYLMCRMIHWSSWGNSC